MKRVEQDPFDILVTVPSQFISSLERKELSSARLSYLVVDEADTLLDSEFGKDIRNIIETTLVT
jgi:superfamily II DNA/RNA helicase